MKVLDNGAIIGNWKKEDGWVKVSPGIEKLELHAKNMTLSFMKIGPEASGEYAPVPSPHIHNDKEQLTILLEGQGTVIVNDKRYPVKKGSHWLAPIGINHGFDLRESPEGILLLQIFPGSTRPALPTDIKDKK